MNEHQVPLKTAVSPLKVLSSKYVTVFSVSLFNFPIKYIPHTALSITQVMNFELFPRFMEYTYATHGLSLNVSFCQWPLSGPQAKTTAVTMSGFHNVVS